MSEPVAQIQARATTDETHESKQTIRVEAGGNQGRMPCMKGQAKPNQVEAITWNDLKPKTRYTGIHITLKASTGQSGMDENYYPLHQTTSSPQGL